MTEMKVTPKYKIRVSSLPIIAKCRAPLLLEGADHIKIKDDVSGLAAGGTAVHEICAEIARTGNRPADLSPWVEKYNCDPDFIGRATWYALKFWDEHKDAYPNPSTELQYQCFMPDSDILLTGHIDLASVTEGIDANILDWKSGYRTDADVEAQVKGYAFLVARNGEVEKVSATVVWLADQTIQSWSWTRAELVEWAGMIAESVSNWGGEYSVGDHCRYCPLFTTCKAQTELARSTISNLALMEPDSGIQLTDIGRLYAGVQNVERMCKMYRDLLRRTVDVNGPIPVDDDTQVVITETTRDTIDPLKAWDVMTEAIGDASELAKCMSVSKTKLLKIVSDMAPRGAKKGAKDQIIEKLHEADAVEQKTIKTLRVVKI